MADSAGYDFYAGLSLRIVPYELAFHKPATTSRNTMHVRKGWYFQLSGNDFPGRTGIGECAPLFGLSIETEENLQQGLHAVQENPGLAITPDFQQQFPSIVMALECAIRSLHAPTPWKSSPRWTTHSRIPINGLVWMGNSAAMRAEAMRKVEEGYKCIKLKIGSTSIAEELRLLSELRAEFPARVMEIRVDANGAFTPAEAPAILDRLAALEIHSIEQPIRQGQWSAMKAICASSPVPVALDEELIGVHAPEERDELIATIRPHYLILKPSLLGGLSSCDDWIQRAYTAGCGWWATSALESNVGLNAIAHWLLEKNVTWPQGLGTGALFTTNTHAFWRAEAGELIATEDDIPLNWYEPQKI